MAMRIDIPKNTREVIRVQRTQFKGYELVDVRVFYQDEDAGEYRPSRKGISLKQNLLPQLINALEGLGQAPGGGGTDSDGIGR